MGKTKALDGTRIVFCSAEEYHMMREIGKMTEHFVGSTLRGGFEAYGYFYFIGRVGDGYRKVSLSHEAERRKR